MSKFKPFAYADTTIIEQVTRDDGMLELTGENGAKYVVFPEEIQA